MEVNSKICKAPIIFLDTSILLKASKGVIQCEDLINLLSRLITERKMISIEGTQRDEIYYGRDRHGIDFLKRYCNATYSLEFIQKQQIFRAICSYLKDDSPKFKLLLNDIFIEDPILTGTSGLRRITDSEALGFTTENKLIELAELLELTRRINNNSNIDYKKSRKNSIRKLIEIWKNDLYFYGALRSNFERFNSFWTSGFFAKIPFIYLFSGLYALITCGTRRIFDEKTRKPIIGKRGDWIDIVSISTLLPYCDYFVMDRFMKDAVRQIAEQDKDYTYINKIYSSSKDDIEKLMEDLNILLKNNISTGVYGDHLKI